MIRDHQIGIPVVVHIGDRYIVRKMTRGNRRTGRIAKLALAVAQQHGDALIVIVTIMSAFPSPNHIRHGDETQLAARGDGVFAKRRPMAGFSADRRTEINERKGCQLESQPNSLRSRLSALRFARVQHLRPTPPQGASPSEPPHVHVYSGK